MPTGSGCHLDTNILPVYIQGQDNDTDMPTGSGWDLDNKILPVYIQDPDNDTGKPGGSGCHLDALQQLQERLQLLLYCRCLSESLLHLRWLRLRSVWSQA